MYAFNKDGSVKWSTDNVSGLFGSPVIAEDGTIYVAGYGLTALNPNGSIKWQHKDINVNETPVIGNDGTIYVHNVWKSRIEAYTPDGTLKWGTNKLFTGNSKTISSLLSKNGILYTLVSSGETNYLYAHDKNGKELWNKYVWSQNSSPGFTLGLNDDIYINGGGKFYIFDKDGNLIKELKDHIPSFTPSYAVSAPAINSKDGTIYIGGENGLYAYNPDYTLKWKLPLKTGRILGAPIIDKNGVVYFTTNGFGGLYAINPDGTLKWKLPDSAAYITDNFSNSSITIDKDGNLYTLAQSGGGVGLDQSYYTLIAIGDDYVDKVCAKDSTYMEVLKSLEAKSKNAKLTDEEKKEARNILSKLSADLDNTTK